MGEWWDLLTARNENRTDGTGGAQLAAVDLQISAPWLDAHLPVEETCYYVEYAGTDIHARWQGDDPGGIFPFVLTDVAVLQGGSLRWGATLLGIEHTRIHRDWYRHPSYPQGYTNGGEGLGHALGPDARSWRIRMELQLPRGATIRSSWETIAFQRTESESSGAQLWCLGFETPLISSMKSSPRFGVAIDHVVRVGTASLSFAPDGGTSLRVELRGLGRPSAPLDR